MSQAQERGFSVQLYTEDKCLSHIYRETYLNGIHDLIRHRQHVCDAERSKYVTPELMAGNREKYLSDLKRMLGWPLTEADPGKPLSVCCSHVADTDKGIISRVQIEVFKGFWYYGLLIVPHRCQEKMPLVICQHGGYGTPELCSDIHGDNNYGHIVWRITDKKAAVFAPQMLLWRDATEDENKFPGYGLPYDRTRIDAQLKQIGSSITALEVYCLCRSLDYLISLPFINEDEIGMLGLSYGGFYTMITAAVDKRLKAAYVSAYYNNRYRYCSPDWSWFASAGKFLDAEISALIAPRALYIELGTQDSVFNIDTAIPEFERLVPFYQIVNASDKLMLSVIDKDHKFDDKDTGLDFLMKNISC